MGCADSKPSKTTKKPINNQNKKPTLASLKNNQAPVQKKDQLQRPQPREKTGIRSDINLYKKESVEPSSRQHFVSPNKDPSIQNEVKQDQKEKLISDKQNIKKIEQQIQYRKNEENKFDEKQSGKNNKVTELNQPSKQGLLQSKLQKVVQVNKIQEQQQQKIQEKKDNFTKTNQNQLEEKIHDVSNIDSTIKPIQIKQGQMNDNQKIFDSNKQSKQQNIQKNIQKQQSENKSQIKQDQNNQNQIDKKQQDIVADNIVKEQTKGIKDHKEYISEEKIKLTLIQADLTNKSPNPDPTQKKEKNQEGKESDEQVQEQLGQFTQHQMELGSPFNMKQLCLDMKALVW